MFAIQANLSEIREQRQRGSWEFALHRARDAQTYTSLYFRRLKGIPLSPEEEVFKFKISSLLELFVSIILSVQSFQDVFPQSRLF